MVSVAGLDLSGGFHGKKQNTYRAHPHVIHVNTSSSIPTRMENPWLQSVFSTVQSTVATAIFFSSITSASVSRVGINLWHHPHLPDDNDNDNMPHHRSIPTPRPRQKNATASFEKKRGEPMTQPDSRGLRAGKKREKTCPGRLLR